MAILASGTCGAEGANVTWQVTDDYTLIFSGSGAMTDEYINYTQQPWKNYRDSIISVIINDGVTSIGDVVCYGFSSLIGVAISNSVTRIGKIAFQNCTALTSIEIPENVDIIENRAFYGCTSLTHVEFLGDAPSTIYGTDSTPSFEPNTTIYYNGDKSGWTLDSNGTWKGYTAVEIMLESETIMTDSKYYKSIAKAIRAKKGATTTYKPSEMATAIRSIETGIDTSDATATASDMANGVTAYVKGEKVTGNVTVRDSGTWGWKDGIVKTYTGDGWEGKVAVEHKLSDNANPIIYKPPASIVIATPFSNFGDATTADVLSGKSFTSSAGLKATGTLTTQAKSATPKSTSQTIYPDTGKLLSSVTVSGDSNLIASNIKSGVSIFGVPGNYSGESGTNIKIYNLSWGDIDITDNGFYIQCPDDMQNLHAFTLLYYDDGYSCGGIMYTENTECRYAISAEGDPDLSSTGYCGMSISSTKRIKLPIHASFDEYFMLSDLVSGFIIYS